MILDADGGPLGTSAELGACVPSEQSRYRPINVIMRCAIAKKGRNAASIMISTPSNAAARLSQRWRDAFARTSAAMRKCLESNSGRFISLLGEHRVGCIAGNHVAAA